ncbi:hypothetical protein ACHMXB_00505 [Arthrobacter sp. UC242_113]|uniref:hypothetical protein n=1 Tax=Arthrobacter sp. UC242_113 TaxID=3374550 RepID=UPI0037583CE1
MSCSVPEVAPACSGEWLLPRGPTAVRPRYCLASGAAGPGSAGPAAVPGLPRLPGPILASTIAAVRILAGRIQTRIVPAGIILPGRGLVPGTNAKVQHARKAGVPVRHSGRKERRTTEGSEHDQMADKPRRRGGRSRVPRQVPVPVPALHSTRVVALHCTPFTAFLGGVASTG